MKVTLVIDGERREVEVDLVRGIARLDGVDRTVRLVSTSPTSVELEIAGERVKVEGWTSDASAPPKSIVVDGEQYRLQAEVVGTAGSAPARIEAPPPSPPTRTPVDSASGDAILPPMPGKVIEVRVKEGERVRKGAVLLVLEAMKMRNEVIAPKDGVVRGLRVAAGDSVSAGEPMLSVTSESPPD